MSHPNNLQVAALTRRMQNANLNLNQVRDVRSSLISVSEIDKAANKWNNCLIGKIIHKDTIEPDDVKKEINIIWRQYKRVEMKVMGRNLFVFKFRNEKDKQEVFKRIPWVINFMLFVLREYDNSIPLENYTFTHHIFSVIFRNLALEHTDDGIIEKMAQDIGQLVEVDGKKCVTIRGRVVTAKILVDLREPLKRGVWIFNAAKQKVWVKYHFEKQPKTTPHCYVIEHDD
ncbi:uncharacterized protein LOC113324333 [Papaver somniferum]|uniref:uncharacterized protein LOC113324333 n=1 Tax=Papaver somniferum TaxID=3469 RepID=UPI000E6FBE6D|nr:uncharacterized protein LOC113324333 [Papaver somniferum]